MFSVGFLPLLMHYVHCSYIYIYTTDKTDRPLHHVPVCVCVCVYGVGWWGLWWMVLDGSHCLCLLHHTEQ